jgi:hypothetical protein
MFTLNSFLKITEVAKSLGYFFRNEGYALILTKMCWAMYILVVFFANSSEGSFSKRIFVLMGKVGA